MFLDEEEIIKRIPRRLSKHEKELAALYIKDSEALIKSAFSQRGRDLEQELQTDDYLETIVTLVVVEMVNKAVAFGGQEGVRSVTSTTGSETDSITFKDVDDISYGGVMLTRPLLERLGLVSALGGLPRGGDSFPPPLRYPEVIYRGNN